MIIVLAAVTTATPGPAPAPAVARRPGILGSGFGFLGSAASFVWQFVGTLAQPLADLVAGRANLAPGNAAQDFVASFERAYGTQRPAFFVGNFMEVMMGGLFAPDRLSHLRRPLLPPKPRIRYC